jgi:cellulase
VELGPVEGLTTHVPWSTWIVNSVVTSATAGTEVGTSTYQASWGQVYETPKPGVGRW